jgi:hypothetical protein
MSFSFIENIFCADDHDRHDQADHRGADSGLLLVMPMMMIGLRRVLCAGLSPGAW